MDTHIATHMHITHSHTYIHTRLLVVACFDECFNLRHTSDLPNLAPASCENDAVGSLGWQCMSGCSLNQGVHIARPSWHHAHIQGISLCHAEPRLPAAREHPQNSHCCMQEALTQLKQGHGRTSRTAARWTGQPHDPHLNSMAPPAHAAPQPHCGLVDTAIPAQQSYIHKHIQLRRDTAKAYNLIMSLCCFSCHEYPTTHGTPGNVNDMVL